MARASAAEAAAARRRILRLAQRVLRGTANADGPGLLERGHEYEPLLAEHVEASVLAGLLRMARLAEAVGEALRECPDRDVRRSAAVLAARAHPVRVAFDG